MERLYICCHFIFPKGPKLPCLFYFALAFVVVPYFISLIFGFFCLCKWRDNRATARYVEKYATLFIVVMIMVGFYETAGIAHSKLFYHDIFHLQIRKKSYQWIKNVKFWNIVVLGTKYSVFAYTKR